METIQQYQSRLKTLQDGIKIQEDNKRQKVLLKELQHYLEKGEKLPINVVDEYNNITRLPF